MAIKNRTEIIFFVEFKNCNPNGDPDLDNMPRMDQEKGTGLITDVCIKYMARHYIGANYGDRPGMEIYVQNNVNLNRKIAGAKELAGYKLDDKDKAAIGETALKACELYFDVRSFGAVMSTGPNGGQVLGTAQVEFAESLDPIQPKNLCITRCAAAVDVKNAKTADAYLAEEKKADASTLRTMGRKWIIPFGLYAFRVYVSANDSKNTGFDETDLEILIEALANMWEAYHSASKTHMVLAGPVVIFKHVGEDFLPEEERANRARLGCASYKKTLGLVKCRKKDGIDVPTSYEDYECSINLSELPNGVRVGFREPFALETVWDKMPDDEEWMKVI